MASDANALNCPAAPTVPEAVRRRGLRLTISHNCRHYGGMPPERPGISGEQARPGPAEIPGYLTSLSNWGRWGADDELGTLNLITGEVTAAAAGLVTAGRPVSCGWPVDPATPDVYGPPQRLMLMGGAGPPPERPAAGSSGPGLSATGPATTGPAATGPAATGPGPAATHRPHRSAVEYIGLAFHGMTVTHLDAPAHVSWDGTLYNGRPATAVRFDTGAGACAVTGAARGISTRGVLLDVAALHGTDWLGPGYRTSPADLEACARRQRVTPRPGDALLLRTGTGHRARVPGGPGLRDEQKPGWGFDCLPWLHARDAALIGCDSINDAVPSGGGGHGFDLPVHLVGLVAMGLWLLDNCDFEELAATCAELGRWEFMFSVLPLRLCGATGSPVNPIALF
jgi:kynurenine formamidase